MALRDLDRRLEKLEAANDPGLSLTGQMEAAFQRQKDRERAWTAAGNEGRSTLRAAL